MTTKPNPADSLFLQRLNTDEVALVVVFDRHLTAVLDCVEPDADVVIGLNQEELHYLCNLLASRQLGNLKTFDEWYEIWSWESEMVIMDEDGFRARGITKQTLFTREEFNRRVGSCTTGPRPKEIDRAE